jgi:hypothetical protein
MTKLKKLSAIAFFSAAIISPVFAQDAGALGPAHHGRAHELRNYRGVYNQSSEPLYAAPRTLYRPDVSGFGFDGREPSWVGDRDPSLNPSGS